LFLWGTDSHAQYLESLVGENKLFQEAPWPSQMVSLQPFLEKQFGQLPSVMSGHDATYYPWTFYEDGPALVRPLFQMTSKEGNSDMQVQPIGFLIVQIDAESLKERYFPQLVDHYFGTSGFRVAVRSAGSPYRPIYLSDPAFPLSTSSPDAQLDLFNSVGEEARRRGHPPVESGDETRQWQLVVQHSSGSLDAAVSSWRRRNLAISLGLLAILASSAVLVFSVARRAERLADFQMEFVAGVSHELCTPLAIINSAVENLADGVVDHPAQVQEYAGILRDQGVRLERLMEQVLLLASGKSGEPECELRPVEVAALVAQTMAMSEPMLRDAGFVVEKEFALNLPPVMADPVAVTKCVENLIGNAMKYGAAGQWIAARVRMVRSRSRDEVQISVEDRGIGISPDDVQRIFDPFYRVQALREGQIRGVGLGLYLVKQMVESVGGRVSVSSEVGKGSCFVLHFPVPASTRQRGSAWSIEQDGAGGLQSTSTSAT
jgi:signal transduction histidine kinase